MRQSIVHPGGLDKSALQTEVLSLVEDLFAQEPQTEFEAEKAVWSTVLALGRVLLTAMLALMCRRLAVASLQERGLQVKDVQFRLDRDYSALVMTTLGKVSVPMFAYRRRSGAGMYAVYCPARTLWPWYPRARSSRLALRFETMLGSRVPFREVERMLALLTHGAVKLHDTTIASHCERVASVVSRTYLYTPKAQIREILAQRAVVDETTGRPIVHFSTDGHAERLLEGGTWQRSWRMLNGIRMWCIDKRTGRSIPLGGEFLVGDCHAVAAAFDDLNVLGILPFDGDYGDGVVAQLVFVVDGMPWFEEHVMPKFKDAIMILDAYHVLEKTGELFSALWGSGSARAKAAYATFCRWVTGRCPSTKATPGLRNAPKPRTGHGKPASYGKEREFPALCLAHAAQQGLPEHSGAGVICALLGLVGEAADERITAILGYLVARLDKIRYQEFWHRGFHISSAAMESFNRVAQQRIKLPGAAWTPAMAQAILNLRMMNWSENDGRFWADDAIMRRLGDAWHGRSQPA